MYFKIISASTLLLLAACGGQDAPAPAGAARVGASAGPAQSIPVQIPEPQLDTPLTAIDIERHGLLPSVAPQARQGAAADSSALSVNTRDREAVRNFYNGLFTRSDKVPMGWTGDYASGKAGTVSAAYQQATALRINWFRAMAGVPAAVTLSDEYSANAQAAALMMSVNGQLSHFPPPDWRYYSSAGYEGASHSNLSLGHAGPDAVGGQFRDAGSNNGPLGHRRTLLYPQTRQMGSGSVPSGVLDGKPVLPANAVWVITSAHYDVRPPVRDDFVAWPPAGFVPYQVVYGRWSFSYPKADFRQASVEVTKLGVPVPVRTEQVVDGFGENSIVWLLDGTTDGLALTVPAADTSYAVTVSNVLVNGEARKFSYTTTIIDPAKPTPGTPVTLVSAPSMVLDKAPFSVSVTPMANASAYQLGLFRRSPLAPDAIGRGSNWLGDSPGYNPVENDSIHLYHATFELYRAQLKTRVLLQKNSSMEFDKETGLATKVEMLKLQLSHDEGMSWIDVYSTAGSGNVAPQERVRVDLSAYAGRLVYLRFALELASPDSFYICSDKCGWRLRNLSLSGAEELTEEQSLTVQAGASILSPSTPGSMLVAARTKYQDRYYGEWGPAANVQVGGLTLTGPRANYTITRSASGYTIADKSGRDGTQSIAVPVRLDFTDMTVDLNLEGNAGTAYRLYRAALNRTPDGGGLGYWIKALDGGATPAGMAAGFTGSKEFREMYGVNPTKQALLTAAYRNVLHRDPDAGGFAYWLAELERGMSVEDMLISFSDSRENRDQVNASLPAGIEYVAYR